MPKQMDEILQKLTGFGEGTRKLRETLLANLVMIGEIPSPTFGEENRIRFLQQRFCECGLLNCSSDEIGNGLAILPGEEGKDNILLVAHADTVHPESVDHTVSLHADKVSGAGIADNSLGLAVLATLPTLLDAMDLKFRSNIILMGGVRSLGRGNLEGLSFFLQNNQMPLKAGICVEGVQLGRLSYSSIGMLRGEIEVTIPEAHDWTRFGATSAIVTLNDVITRINEIPVPRRPKTNIFMGMIEGGKSFNTVATNALLRFEIRSESADIVAEISTSIEDIASEVAVQTDADIRVDYFAKRQPGSLGFRHPLAQTCRSIMRELELEPKAEPSTSELSAFLDRKIPAVTIGLTNGEHLSKREQRVEIDPIFKGVSQLLAILTAVDRGYCDEH